jgi:zinc transport system substrate-binding protein
MSLLMGCGEPPKQAKPSSSKPLVMTTFYPTTFFTQNIAGDLIQLESPLPEGEDPIFWKPSVEIIQNYQSADLIIINGTGFEKWVDGVNLPRNKVINSSGQLSLPPIHYQGGQVHSHGPAGSHSHRGLDGHTWLDPIHAMEQSQAIYSALTELLPKNALELQKNFDSLKAKLSEIDTQFKSLKKWTDHTPLLMSHPAYNYLSRRYSWSIVNLDLDPDEMPKQDIFDEIKKIKINFPAKILIWESTPKTAIAKRIEDELDLQSIVFSPCETISPEDLDSGDDYLKIMNGHIKALASILTTLPTKNGSSF